MPGLRGFAVRGHTERGGSRALMLTSRSQMMMLGKKKKNTRARQHKHEREEERKRGYEVWKHCSQQIPQAARTPGPCRLP